LQVLPSHPEYVHVLSHNQARLQTAVPTILT
jgi:hypothetical protein